MTKTFTFALLAGAASLSSMAAAQTYAPPPAPLAAPAPMMAPEPPMTPAPPMAAQGPLAGTAIGGVSNAVWADQNNDGVVDGYVQNGQYYPGAPQAVPASAPAPTNMPPPPPARGERG